MIAGLSPKEHDEILEVTFDQHHEPIWRKYSHDAVVNAASWDKSGLPEHDLWKVIFELVNSEYDANLLLRLNNDAGASYRYTYITEVAVVSAIDQNEIIVCGISDGSPAMGSFIVETHRLGTDSRRQVAGDWIAAWFYSRVHLIHATHRDAAADVNRITLLSSDGNFTGDIDLWYKDW